MDGMEVGRKEGPEDSEPLRKRSELLTVFFVVKPEKKHRRGRDTLEQGRRQAGEEGGKAYGVRARFIAWLGWDGGLFLGRSSIQR